MFELRPPLLETHGLEAATRDAAAVLARTTGMEVRVSAVGTTRYTPAVEAMAFRTLQEALANVRKHAQATTVQIDLRDDGDSLHTRVIDDGRGFDVGATASPSRERMHYGIAMMTERVRLAGGDCWISSAPGHGCTVSFSLPHGTGEG
jgi:signal transduction histidine kinase